MCGQKALLIKAQAVCLSIFSAFLHSLKKVIVHTKDRDTTRPLVGSKPQVLSG
jgi:hypothetical protein